MGIIYSGQTILNTMLDASSADSLGLGLRNALQSVGWSITKDGSTDAIWRLHSGTTPQGLSGDVWIRKATSGTYPAALINASSKNAQAYNTQYQAGDAATCNVAPGYNYRLIANPYYFYLLREALPCPPLQSFMMHIPYVPPFLESLVAELVIAHNPAGMGSQSLCNPMPGGNATYSQVNGSGSFSGMGFQLWAVTSANKALWFDDSSEFYEARVQAKLTSVSAGGPTGPLKTFGYLWDALIANFPMVRGTLIPYDGSSWYVFSESVDPGLLVKVA